MFEYFDLTVLELVLSTGERLRIGTVDTTTLRADREQHQVRVLGEHIHQRPSSLL